MKYCWKGERAISNDWWGIPTPQKKGTRGNREEITMISLKIRGFNTETKRIVIGSLIQHEAPHLICLNETKLQIPLYLNNYWSYETMLQRNGGS
jgi:hypothetical protein